LPAAALTVQLPTAQIQRSPRSWKSSNSVQQVANYLIPDHGWDQAYFNKGALVDFATALPGKAPDGKGPDDNAPASR
jgi:hypothetical protein